MSSNETVLQNERVIQLAEAELGQAGLRAERTDNQLVDLVLGGDETAFEELFERHKRLLAIIAGRRFRRSEDIAALARMSFTKAFRQLANFRARYEHCLSSWL